MKGFVEHKRFSTKETSGHMLPNNEHLSQRTLFLLPRCSGFLRTSTYTHNAPTSTATTTTHSSSSSLHTDSLLSFSLSRSFTLTLFLHSSYLLMDVCTCSVHHATALNGIPVEELEARMRPLPDRTL
jgi:hypothetical protein